MCMAVIKGGWGIVMSCWIKGVCVGLLLLPLGFAAANAQLRGHGGPVRALAVSPDGKNAISGSFDSSAIYWSLTRNVAEQVLRFHESAVNAVAFGPFDRIITAGEDGRIRCERRPVEFCRFREDRDDRPDASFGQGADERTGAGFGTHRQVGRDAGQVTAKAGRERALEGARQRHGYRGTIFRGAAKAGRQEVGTQ